VVRIGGSPPSSKLLLELHQRGYLMSDFTHTLFFVNNSSQPAMTACLYQVLRTPTAGSFPVAWLTKPAAPTTTVKFSWDVTYDFVWSQSGALLPGALVSASQTWQISDTATRNQVTLTSGDDDALTFEDQTAGPAEGILTIVQNGTIPAGAASVGIGMAGAPICLAQAGPNLKTSFKPLSAYWLAFGAFSEGQVLDPSSIPNPKQIVFPANVHSMTATLGASNTWSVVPTSQINDSIAAAVEIQALSR
jgi:hypothetical protein